MIIGITGGIGSGKSTIAREIAALGYPVYDCDSQAKRLILSDSTVREKIIGLLGCEAYCGQQYNTSYVASRVFAEPALLQALNQIVHPAVFSDIQSWVSSREADSVQPEFFFVESAILYSSGLSQLCDGVVIVTAPLSLRIDRTMLRDNASRQQVMSRITAQDEREQPLQPKCSGALRVPSESAADFDAGGVMTSCDSSKRFVRPWFVLTISNDGSEKIADLVQNMFYNIRATLA